MADIEKVIKGIWQCWLPSDEEEYETQCHDCPYYKDGITLKECMTELRTDAIALLKEQEQKKRKWLQTIADIQLAVSPTGYETDEELAKRTGEWNGLQMAWEIITGEERSEHPHIVRCKDCLHFVHVRTDAIGHCTKDISCWVFRDMNWFCADGKKEQTD